MGLDKRALKILSDTYWSSSGWKRDPAVRPEDFAYARSRGVMFDPDVLSHDDAIDAAIAAVKAADKAVVAEAFVASLRSRRLDLRSALGSFAVGRHMRVHRTMTLDGSVGCRYCGAYQDFGDLNILNFERVKWGGVRHYDPRYIAFDLQLFAAQKPGTPTAEDFRILAAVLDVANSMPSTARPGDLEKALSKLLPSNSAERRTLIGLLGYAGILVDPTRPNFLHQFVPDVDREPTRWHKDDWPYPVQWWNGSHGVNDVAVAEWFPGI